MVARLGELQVKHHDHLQARFQLDCGAVKRAVEGICIYVSCGDVQNDVAGLLNLDVRIGRRDRRADGEGTRIRIRHIP